jgi:hypothetical protein
METRFLERIGTLKSESSAMLLVSGGHCRKSYSVRPPLLSIFLGWPTRNGTGFVSPEAAFPTNRAQKAARGRFQKLSPTE